jgi:hypothetical protein
MVKRLSGYELACGCVQTKSSIVHPDGVSVLNTTLWKEHSVYHVRSHEHSERGRLVWNTFDTLQKAQKNFTAQVRTFHRQSQILGEL